MHRAFPAFNDEGRANPPKPVGMGRGEPAPREMHRAAVADGDGPLNH